MNFLFSCLYCECTQLFTRYLSVLSSSSSSSVCDFSSKVEMGKWIEDLNLAIDMAKKSQEKSSIFLDAGLGDHSNRKSSFSPRCYPEEMFRTDL